MEGATSDLHNRIQDLSSDVQRSHLRDYLHDSTPRHEILKSSAVNSAPRPSGDGRMGAWDGGAPCRAPDQHCLLGTGGGRAHASPGEPPSRLRRGQTAASRANAVLIRVAPQVMHGFNHGFARPAPLQPPAAPPFPSHSKPCCLSHTSDHMVPGLLLHLFSFNLKKKENLEMLNKGASVPCYPAESL